QTHAVGVRQRLPVHHQVDEIEDLQNADRHHDDGEKDHGGQHGQSDLKKHLTAAGAVQTGSLIIGAVNALHSCQHDDNIVADHGPDHHQDDCPSNIFYITQPGDPGKAQLLQDPVEDAVLIVENPPPQDTDRCRDGNCRDKQQSPVDRAAPDLLVDLMGQKDGEDDDQRHAHHGIEHRVLQRQPEGVILQQVLIVLQADEGPLPEGPHLPKAVEDILNEGNDTEQQQSRKHGQDEDVRSAHLRASEPAEMPCLIFHGRSSCFPVSPLGRPWAQNRVPNRSALLGPRT
ncbi:DNA replication protein DnaC, partial [Dysosmobacter welbionis]